MNATAYLLEFRFRYRYDGAEWSEWKHYGQYFKQENAEDAYKQAHRYEEDKDFHYRIRPVEVQLRN